MGAGGVGGGKPVFLVKINLPPFYSLLLLLFVHAFLPYAPPLPPFSTFSILPSPFLSPSFSPALLTVYSYTVGGVGVVGWGSLDGWRIKKIQRG